jgi:peptide/nickel transport system permease protein
MQEQPVTAPGVASLLDEGRRKKSISRGIIKFVRKKPLGAIGAMVVIILVFVAIFAHPLSTHDPFLQDIPGRLQGPTDQNWFGTDHLGRDVYSRVIHGARISLYVGLFSVALSTFIGLFIGVNSGYFGGVLDLAVQRWIDTMMGFPGIVLLMLLVVALGASLQNVILALAIGSFPSMTRITRSTTLSIKEEMYILAAQAIGCTSPRVMIRHVIPNGLAPVFVVATGSLGGVILAEAGLSFLGLGVPPPAPSWGGMVNIASRGFLESAPWLTIFPGIALSSVVLGFALFGDALRDVLDPRLRGS